MYAENKPAEQLAPKIYLSPSQDSSGRCILGDDEKSHCNQYIDHLTEYLDALGILWKRSSGSLAEAALESEHWNPDIHYAVHTGAYNGLTRYSAFYVHSAESASPAYLCAEQLKKSRADVYHRPIYVTQNRELYEIMKVSAPCVYDRIAFHDNLEDAQFLHKNLRRLARSAAVGFAAYFNIPFEDPGDPVDRAVFSGAQFVGAQKESAAPQPVETEPSNEVREERQPDIIAPQAEVPQTPEINVQTEKAAENPETPNPEIGTDEFNIYIENAPRGNAYDWVAEEYAQCEKCREKKPVAEGGLAKENVTAKQEVGSYGTTCGCENVMRLYEAEAEAHRATRKEYAELIKKYNEMRSKRLNTASE
ncbi:MAG: hypothetical protein LBQ48_03985 [Oscillospiraceae bacterium]|jgi:N-acetylmuramoyl-L-alanine amidase|nr:hypothetical protein [Oscillospiraceae bacterium]